jgi:DNA topoisomerase I
MSTVAASETASAGRARPREADERLDTGLSLAVFVDPEESARAAGLRYVNDDLPGIRRRRRGKGWSYLDPKGRTIRDRKVRERIEKLAIPPAWTDVWICPFPNGHLQATGRDARGRKQYRYHPDWREVRDETKFNRMIAFGEALPTIRERVERDLSLSGLPRAKVVAAVVRLLETTLIRVGNTEYARRNRSFGLTTLRDRHAKIRGAKVKFEFHGKGGKRHRVEVSDRRLARVVKRCRDIPGQTLFQYWDDDGERQSIASEDVNEYLREITGEEFSAKDFRTWGGTVLALSALLDLGPSEDEKAANRSVVEAVKRVSSELGNRPAVCRKFYVHPAVLDAYADGDLQDLVQEVASEVGEEAPEGYEGLERLETQVLELLKQRAS